MKKRTVALATLGVALVAFVVWIAIPPFPSASEFVGVPYSTVVARLGPPTDSLPEKSIYWYKTRGIAVWVLEIQTENPTPEPTWVATTAERSLWFPALKFSIPLEYVTSARVYLPKAKHPS